MSIEVLRLEHEISPISESARGVPNVEVTGAAQLHRAASVWTAGLCFQIVNFRLSLGMLLISKSSNSLML